MLSGSLTQTPLFAGILGVAFALASLFVGLTRVATKKFYGADHNSQLEFRSRAAGTIGEYSAFGIPLLALLEYNAVLSPGKIWWWGFLFTFTRLTHAVQLAQPRSLPMLLRMVSFLTTLALIGFASVALLRFGYASK